VMLQLNKVRGDRSSYCFDYGGVDFEEDSAIANVISEIILAKIWITSA
jgi:hypothetical protein